MRQQPAPADDDSPEVRAGSWTVSGLVDALRGLLSERFGGELWVEGEISGLTRRPDGNVFFDLVERDDDGSRPRAVLPVALFTSARRHVNRVLRSGGGVRMVDGMQVRIRARVDLVPTTGRLTLRMSGIDPTFTLGVLADRRDAVMRRLAPEGLLGANRLCPMPPVPLRVGLVTAASSAAEADVLHEFAATPWAWRVHTADVRVQGRDAAASVVSGLRAVAAVGVDAVLLVRGGGARTDLATFDDEGVARAVAGLGTPVVTGIGHETDRSVADEVAHTACKTPTAAAAHLRWVVEGSVGRLDDAAIRLAHTTRRRLALAEAHLDATGARVVGAARRQVTRCDASLESAATRVVRASDAALRRAETTVELATARLDSHDPARLMALGWSVTRSADGRVLRDPTELEPGQELLTVLAGGEVTSTVVAVRLDRHTHPDHSARDHTGLDHTELNEVDR